MIANRESFFCQLCSGIHQSSSGRERRPRRTHGKEKRIFWNVLFSNHRKIDFPCNNFSMFIFLWLLRKRKEKKSFSTRKLCELLKRLELCELVNIRYEFECQFFLSFLSENYNRMDYHHFQWDQNQRMRNFVPSFTSSTSVISFQMNNLTNEFTFHLISFSADIDVLFHLEENFFQEMKIKVNKLKMRLLLPSLLLVSTSTCTFVQSFARFNIAIYIFHQKSL